MLYATEMFWRMCVMRVLELPGHLESDLDCFHDLCGYHYSLICLEMDLALDISSTCKNFVIPFK